MPASLSSRLHSGAIGFALAVVLIAGTAVSDTTHLRQTAQEDPPHPDFPHGSGADPNAPAMALASDWNVLNWGPGPIATGPMAYGYDTVVDGQTKKRILVATGSNADVASANTQSNLSISEDSGLSFPTTTKGEEVTGLNMTRLPDGSLIAVDFIPEWADAAKTKVNILTHYSKDGGKTWRLRKGLFTPPAGEVFAGTDRGLRVHRNPIVLTDGTILVPMYTVYQSQRIRSSNIMQSTDGGESWTQRSRITAAVGVNEAGWSYTTDGGMVAALRTESAPNSLMVSYSHDDAKTWTQAVPLLGPDGKQVVGINPHLVLQPNGVLLLATGRPDDRVMVSYDGLGRTWNESQVVYANAPSTTGNGRFDGASGNNSIVNVGANRTIYFGDKCHVWGCGAYNEQFGAYARYVSAVTRGTGKLDVATQVRAGVATVTGKFAKEDKRFPETRPEGAFDGSSGSTAAAVLQERKPDRAPSMTLKLDQAYSINRIGLMLGAGIPSDATVSLSLDGTTWSAPVIVASQRVDRSLRYTDVLAQQAQYVRVIGAAGKTTAVTELELYANDVLTFENDPIFNVPRGFTEAQHAWTTDVPPQAGTTEMGGFRSSSALRLWDKWFDYNATATKVTADAAHQTTSFDFGVSDHRGPFVFGLKGHAGDTGTTPWLFRLVDSPAAQRVEVFDGTTWSSLGNLNAKIALFTWAKISVDATLTEAKVTINGQTFTTTTRAQETDSLAGVYFSTGEPLAYGMAFFIDNLRIA